MIWSYEAEEDGHHFQLRGRLDNNEAWKSLQQQILLLLDPKPNKVIRLTLDCSELQESKKAEFSEDEKRRTQSQMAELN